MERRLVIQENGDNEDDVRELVESTPIGTIPMSQTEMAALRNQFIEGHSVMVELEEGQTTFYFQVDGVSSFTPADGTTTCDVYTNVEVENGGNLYSVRVECCPYDSHCDYYSNYESYSQIGEGRRLKGCIDNC